MKINRSASAAWQGGLKDGVGSLSTESGALAAYPYGFAARFEGKKGSNPEELLGAAHAGCFTMAMSLALEEAGLRADKMDTKAVVTLEKQGDGFAITHVALHIEAAITGLDDAKFQEIATAVKAACPISKVLNAEISLEATLL